MGRVKQCLGCLHMMIRLGCKLSTRQRALPASTSRLQSSNAASVMPEDHYPNAAVYHNATCLTSRTVSLSAAGCSHSCLSGLFWWYLSVGSVMPRWCPVARCCTSLTSSHVAGQGSCHGGLQLRGAQEVHCRTCDNKCWRRLLRLRRSCEVPMRANGSLHNRTERLSASPQTLTCKFACKMAGERQAPFVHRFVWSPCPALAVQMLPIRHRGRRQAPVAD